MAKTLARLAFISSLLGANEETACAFLLDFGLRLKTGWTAEASPPEHGFSLPGPHEMVTHPAQEAEAVI
jgi:hypothetical protein